MNIGGRPHDVESPHRAVLIPGDGIGPEVTEASGVEVARERVEAGAEVVSKYGARVPDAVIDDLP